MPLSAGGGTGPIRSEIELRRAGLALFSQADQNTILRTTMRIVADFWIKAFMPQRFSPYARTFLGYYASGKWEKRKAKLANAGTIQGPQPTPFVYTGIAKASAISGARPDGTASATKFTAIIRIPFGHAIQPQTSEMFKVVPAHEIRRMAEVVAKTLPALINSGVATYNERGAQMQLAGATSPRSAGAAVPRKAA